MARGGTSRTQFGSGGLDQQADGDDTLAAFDHPLTVALGPDGILASTCGTTDLTVNSVDYRGIDRPAGGLTVEAQAGDGLVEAVPAERGGARVIGVQWHPEHRPEAHPDRARFFGLLGRGLRGATLPGLSHAS